MIDTNRIRDGNLTRWSSCKKNLFRKCGKCFSVKTKFVWFRHENCRKSEKPKQTMDNDIMFTEEAYICTAGEDINVEICKTIFVYCRAVHKNSHNVRFHSRILQRSAKHRLFWELNRVCYIMTQASVICTLKLYIAEGNWRLIFPQSCEMFINYTVYSAIQFTWSYRLILTVTSCENFSALSILFYDLALLYILLAKHPWTTWCQKGCQKWSPTVLYFPTYYSDEDHAADIARYTVRTFKWLRLALCDDIFDHCPLSD